MKQIVADQLIGELIADLKRTGLWDQTSEGVGKPGRDHNWHGFSMWPAGAGVRGGQSMGAGNDPGFQPVEERCHVSDLRATILHLIGLDHLKLTHFYSGRNGRITGVRGEVVKKVLA